jgi:CheY-like chemotaxis protein
MSEEELYLYCKNKTVLIADNDKNSYDLLSELLADYQFKILYAKSGESAVSLFKENPSIIMVLMEIRLPGLDGFIVFKKIREINPNVPVIAQTADALFDIEQKCINAGFNDYILKPINFNLFIKIIRKHLLMRKRR